MRFDDFDNLRNHYRGRYYKCSQFSHDCQEVREYIQRTFSPLSCESSVKVLEIFTNFY